MGLITESLAEEKDEVASAGVRAGDERIRIKTINDTCDSFKSRLKIGDVIVSFGNTQIYSLKTMKLAMRVAGGTPDGAEFTILRDGNIGLLELKRLPEDIAADLVTVETITVGEQRAV